MEVKEKQQRSLRAATRSICQNGSYFLSHLMAESGAASKLRPWPSPPVPFQEVKRSKRGRELGILFCARRPAQEEGGAAAWPGFEYYLAPLRPGSPERPGPK